MGIRPLISVAATLAVGACAGVTTQPRAPGPVAADAGRFTGKVQKRSEAPAKDCDRATTGAVLVLTNVQAPLSRKEPVSQERHAELNATDANRVRLCPPFSD